MLAAQNQDRAIDFVYLRENVERHGSSKHLGFNFSRALQRKAAIRQLISPMVDVIP
jgi:hypothetical protein